MEINYRVDSHGLIGLSESFKVQRYRSGSGWRVFSAVDLSTGGLVEPSLFISETFQNLSERSLALGDGSVESGLDRYLSARKPIYALFRKNTVPVVISVKGTATEVKTSCTPVSLKRKGQKFSTVDLMPSERAKLSVDFGSIVTELLGAGVTDKKSFYMYRIAR